MDPYIEDPEVWSDFQNDLAGEIRAALNQQIQPRYVARIVPRVTYDDPDLPRERSVIPDAGIWRQSREIQSTYQSSTVLVPTPVESNVAYEDTLRYASVEILRTGTLELVTAIEILSPVNKRRGHKEYERYLAKRHDILRSEAHLFEIDLLRGGTRPPLQRPVPSAPYYVTLSRVESRPRVLVWPIQLNDRLPFVPVPLLEPDADANLDLTSIVAQVYDRGGYTTLIDYREPPPPPKLSPPELEYVDALLKPIREHV